MRRTAASGEDPWDAVVLQVGRGADSESRFAEAEVLRCRYAPLILDTHPRSQVVLYQTWSEPYPGPSEAALMAESLAEYQGALREGGLQTVCCVRAGLAFLGVARDPHADRRVYPALFKDDSGHGSALAGALVAAAVALPLGLAGPLGGPSPCRSLGRILEAMLPSAWRTASAGFAGDAEFGQKLWTGVSAGDGVGMLSGGLCPPGPTPTPDTVPAWWTRGLSEPSVGLLGGLQRASWKSLGGLWGPLRGLLRPLGGLWGASCRPDLEVEGAESVPPIGPLVGPSLEPRRPSWSNVRCVFLGRRRCS
ncbi:unnamed protein product [Prorocentrum cordatum]|uniref:Subtilisin n=1 Tax=Prorocentrum cordatum TaxID=2364126 RepID=A0ABN9XE16_9DINO|nr:unnamed protein product [Polarella glacialis]